jgi:autotransporter translocation and assembly factor TamB
MIKALKRLAIILISILCLFILALTFVLTTQTGTQLAVHIARELSHNAFTVTDVQGQLGSHVVLNNIRYENDSLQFTAEHITLDWQALALLKTRLHIERFIVQDAKIIIKKTEPAEEKQSSWSLPFPYQVDQLQLENISFKHPLLQGNFNANGYLKRSPDLNWQLHIQGNQWGSTTTSDQLPKNFNFVLDSSGNLQDFNVNLSQLSGSWQKLPLQGGLKLRVKTFNLPRLDRGIQSSSTSRDLFAGSRPNFVGAKNTTQPTKSDLTSSSVTQLAQRIQFTLDSHLQWGITQLAINGGLSDRWQLSYKANIADLSKIAPQLHGGVTANGNISGAAASPKLHGIVNLQNFTVPGLSTHIDAKLNTDIAASLNDQTFTAAVSANNIAIALPELGLTPRITNLKVTLADKILHYNAALQSGPGTLTLQGKTTLTQDPPLSTMTLTGKDLLVSNTPKIKVLVSPDLKIEQQKDGWHVTGKAHIPKANIDLGDTRKTVTLPHETVIINKTGKVEKASSQPFFAEVALTVGNDVHVAMAGLKSKVGGAVTLYEIPNQETRADGKLLLPEGSYDLQGQKLNVANSEIIFVNSPVTNPALNITASKTIQHAPSATTLSDKQSFIVGLKVTGKADNPIITLFSDPSGWSQPDILSLIVFGQPASTLSNSSMGVLAAAAQALGSKSGKPGVAGQLTSQLQHFFGLSELSLQSTVGSDTDSNATSTSFVLGKYLSPRLYLNYSLGLEGNITLRLRYLLSKHWSVQTQASTVGSGVDLFYSMGK